MGQRIDRIVPAHGSGASLADNGVVELHNGMATLEVDNPVYLFEYEACGQVVNIDDGDFVGDSLAIALIKSGVSGSQLDADLAGSVLGPEDRGPYTSRQERVFEIAEWELVQYDKSEADDVMHYNWKLHFRPGNKGGIPFLGGVGWKLVFINRTGSALPATPATAIVTNRIKQRYAYGK